MSLGLEKQRDFLFQTYFGVKGDELDLFISRAYRDMNRTLHGIGKLNKKLKNEVFTKAKELVKQSFTTLRNKTAPDEVEKLRAGFDDWHSKSCSILKKHYAKKLNSFSKTRLTYGQAQKWLNMTLKYCWVCGGDEIKWLDPWFKAAHMPIDAIIIKAVKGEKVKAALPPVTWSKWNSESEYATFQNALRRHADKEEKSPLELEFEWWPRYRSPQADSEDGD
jgi:hypothetical protein